jgi:hypothetical protein
VLLAVLVLGCCGCGVAGSGACPPGVAGCGRLCGGGRKGILQGAGRARDDVMFKPTSPEHCQKIEGLGRWSLVRAKRAAPQPQEPQPLINHQTSYIK